MMTPEDTHVTANEARALRVVCPTCGYLHPHVPGSACICCKDIDEQRANEPGLVMVECPTCAGEGRITVESPSGTEFERTCPDCDGDGVLPAGGAR